MSKNLSVALKNLENYDNKYFDLLEKKKKVEQEKESSYNDVNNFIIWGQKRSFDPSYADELIPNVRDRSSFARKKNSIKKQIFSENGLNIDGSKCTLESVKNGFFAYAPKEISHLKSNNEYDDKIKKYALEINQLKNDLSKKINFNFERICGVPTTKSFFLTFLSFMIGVIIFLLGVVLSKGILIFLGVGGLTLFGLSLKNLIAEINIDKNLKEAREATKKAINSFNYKSAEIYMNALIPLVQSYIDEKKNGYEENYQIKLSDLEKDKDNIINEYYNGETLSQEAINLYFSLDKPERELFVKLGSLVETEKELADIYMKCKNQESQRIILEQEKIRVQEAQKQTMLQEKQNKEIERQTKILNDSALATQRHMDRIAQQNTEANKALTKYNKEQLNIAKKQLKTAKNIEQEQWLQKHNN